MVTQKALLNETLYLKKEYIDIYFINSFFGSIFFSFHFFIVVIKIYIYI
jgi:hypothetical protein